MSRLTNYANFIILLLSVALFFSLESQTHISTSLLSVLPESNDKEVIQKFETLHSSKILIVAVKGFDEQSLETISKLETELGKIDHVQVKKLSFNSELKKHQNRYAYYIDRIDQEKLKHLNVKSELSKLYESLSQSFFPVNINQQDPFDLYIKQAHRPIKLQNNHLFIENYGYLTYFELSSQNLEEHTKVYNRIKNTVASYKPKEVLAFSPIFYYVENSQAMKSDINHIIFFALSALLILYFFILKNIRLMVNAMVTLVSSAIIAIMVTTSLYPNVSIFVIVFGVSISTISIDYLFHHYLHGYYSESKGFNREVFFGFLTTLGAFVILSFTEFTLIRQISIFSIFSLTIAYLHFAFLYPHIGFIEQKSSGVDFISFPIHFSYKTIFTFSVLILILSPLWLALDLNVKNLDYDNQLLQEKEAFFKKHISQDEMIPVLIEANSIDQLIEHSKKVKSLVKYAHIPLSGLVDAYSFVENGRVEQSMSLMKKSLSNQAVNIGFREGYFSEAYLTDLLYPRYSVNLLDNYGITLLHVGSKYIAYGSVDKKSFHSLTNLSCVKSLSVKSLFEKSMKKDIDTLVKLGMLAVLFIFVMLLLVTRSGVIRALTYMVFPLAIIMVYAFFVPLNILHIFMTFIVISISIDYAIYTAKSIDVNTKKAITFSLMSTFAGFGVLIFSTINALYSMGVIATLGIISLFILLIFIKGSKNVS